MIHRKNLFAGLAAFVLIGNIVFAGEINTVSLKPYLTDSPFDSVKADWLLPRGRRVFDGVPWQIDGVVLLYADSYLQQEKPERTNINNIPIGHKFDRLHLLAAAQTFTKGTPIIAKIHLQYTDGNTSTLPLTYDVDVSSFKGRWHKPEEPVKNHDVHEAWHAQCDATAVNGNYLRLFHVPLANPNPEKEVRSISLESTKESVALFVVAMSVGPANAAPLPSESLGKAPFPDLRHRSGQPAVAEGFIYDSTGKPLADANVKIILSRRYEDNGPAETGVGSETKTDANGHFALPGLRDDCGYRLLIAADNFIPFIYHGVDPISDPVAVRLEPVRVTSDKFVARARITDPSGKPLAFAQVDREGIGSDRSTSFGGASEMPETVVTDKHGEFVLSQNQPFTRVQIKVNAPGLAPLHQWIPVANSTTALQMTVGSTIRGRVLDLNNKPLANVKLGISGADRSSEVYVGDYTTTAQADGTFQFEHVIAGTNWNLYGTISSFKKFGALPSRRVSSYGDGETNDLGDLQIIKSLRLAGQVKTRHGEPLPKDLKVSLGYDKASDHQTAVVDADGRFAFEGLYPEKINISIQDRNWKLAGLNRSLSFYNVWQMEGMLEKNKDDLLLLIEKGAGEYNYDSSNGSLPPNDNPASKPIAGAENMETEAIILAGTVIDDQTGQPIANCKIVPGYKPTQAAWGIRIGQPQKNLVQKLLKPLATKQVSTWEMPFWMSVRAEQTTNGSFSIPFIPLQSTPMLRIEAAGYQPVVTEPIPSSTNGLVIRMSHGEGPSGIVLLPDGNPAENASVHYAGAREQFSLKQRDFTLYGGSKKRVLKTAADGAFKFPMLAENAKVFAAHPAGYAEQLVSGKDEKLKIHLRPWATLMGMLMNSNGSPATNVELGLLLYDGTRWNPAEPMLNYQERVKTDNKGAFLFSNVPPRRIHISRLVPVTTGPMAGRVAWTYREQTWLDVAAGTNDLGNITLDSPPAEPVVEQLKRKLGL
ncbi:MAG: hypothetical protein ACXWDN_07120 [Limisphaerales bacterium]